MDGLSFRRVNGSFVVDGITNDVDDTPRVSGPTIVLTIDVFVSRKQTKN